MDRVHAVNFNGKVRLKLPKARLYRTNSIARELRNRGVQFEWFTKNSIAIELPIKDSSERRRTLFITGSLTCYKVRFDIWHYVSGGDFTYTEIQVNDGATLIFKLVQARLVPESWLPPPPKFFYEPHGHVGL